MSKRRADQPLYAPPPIRAKTGVAAGTRPEDTLFALARENAARSDNPSLLPARPATPTDTWAEILELARQRHFMRVHGSVKKLVGAWCYMIPGLVFVSNGPPNKPTQTATTPTHAINKGTRTHPGPSSAPPLTPPSPANPATRTATTKGTTKGNEQQTNNGHPPRTRKNKKPRTINTMRAVHQPLSGPPTA